MNAKERRDFYDILRDLGELGGTELEKSILENAGSFFLYDIPLLLNRKNGQRNQPRSLLTGAQKTRSGYTPEQL